MLQVLRKYYNLRHFKPKYRWKKAKELDPHWGPVNQASPTFFTIFLTSKNLKKQFQHSIIFIYNQKIPEIEIFPN